MWELAPEKTLTNTSQNTDFGIQPQFRTDRICPNSDQISPKSDLPETE